MAFAIPTLAADEGLDFFEKKIRPVLIERCYKCHSAASQKPKGGLRLDRKSSLLDGGDSGPAVAPGKPEESLLFQAISWSDGISVMPPDSKLPDRVIADFREWIVRGAPFPADSAPVAAKQLPVDIESGR
ncbi:MAG: Planctomycete cytochrome [Planctomycetaceae bacterium]|nr:Planctomycete cytochrome [Planctomycetaceae bacterium]